MDAVGFTMVRPEGLRRMVIPQGGGRDRLIMDRGRAETDPGYHES